MRAPSRPRRSRNPMLSLRELQLRFSAALTPGPGDGVDRPNAPGVGQRSRGPRSSAATRDLRRDVPHAPRRRAPRGLPSRPRDPRRGGVQRAGGAIPRPPSVDASVRPPRGSPVRRLRGGRGGGAPFLGDLARLEWARVEVFDAPDAEPLRLSDLSSIPPEDWPALRFRPIPACLVIECAWPVHEIWAAADTPAPLPARAAGNLHDPGVARRLERVPRRDGRSRATGVSGAPARRAVRRALRDAGGRARAGGRPAGRSARSSCAGSRTGS